MEYRHTLNNQHEVWGGGVRLIVAFWSEYESGNAENCYNNSHKYNSPAIDVSMYGQIPRKATRSCLCYEDVSTGEDGFWVEIWFRRSGLGPQHEVQVHLMHGDFPHTNLRKSVISKNC